MNFYLIDGFLPGPNLKKSAPDFLTVNMARLDGYEHAEVPMDNNTAERGLRGGAVGRKNYYGSSSIRSAEFTAIMFTIIQTLLIWNLNPHAWFSGFFDFIGGGWDKNFSHWLPWNMSMEQRTELALKKQHHDPP